MVLTGSFSLTNWINSRPVTRRPVSVNRNTRACRIVATAAGSADNPFPEGGGDANFDKSSSSWNISARNWPLILKTIAFHTTHIAARLLSQPFQPALEKIQQRAASSATVKSACAAFQVEDLASLQDVANALILSECVYKVVGRPEQEAVRMMSSLKSIFPPGIVTINQVQFARSHVAHRFAISQSDDAMYVAFMGTKLPRDFIANVQAWQDEVELDADTVVKSNDPEKMNIASSSDVSLQAPAAHRGFLARARTIPIDALFAEAQKKGKRLVLCGHSLGGAVATLTAISLLQKYPEQHNVISCVGFATPALGNKALAALVKENRWDRRIRNYLVPEDPIPRLLSINNNNNNNNSPFASHLTRGGGSSSGSGSSNAASTNNGNVEQKSNSENLPSQFDVVGNIAAALPGRLISFSGRSASTQKQQQTEEPLLETAVAARAVGAAAAIEEEVPINAGLRRSISQGTLKLVGKATQTVTAPLRRPIYQTIGRQLYICEGEVTTLRPISTKNNSRTGTSSSIPTSNTSPPSTTTGTATTTDAVEKTASPWQWWSEKFPFLSSSSPSLAFPPTSVASECEGDDDNVDIAVATAAAAGGTIPDRLPRRTLFPMHRMLTYRKRLLSICNEALSTHTWSVYSLLSTHSSKISYSLPPNFPHPDDIVLSELLAPGMFPLKAEASVSSLALVENRSQPVDTFLRTSPTKVPLVVAAGQKLASSLRSLLRRPRNDSKADASRVVDVVVRVEGRGLSNVTSAWVSGGRVDALSGKSAPIEAEIISLPKISTQKSSKSSSPQKNSGIDNSVSALVSWVAMAVGWVSLLRQLQKPSRSDFVLAKVKLPASTVRAAQKARDPFSVAVGEVPKLMVHLQSDFAVHSVPLTVEIKPDEGSGLGGGGKNNQNHKSSSEVQARYKDANEFLRNVKTLRLPHL